MIFVTTAFLARKGLSDISTQSLSFRRCFAGSAQHIASLKVFTVSVLPQAAACISSKGRGQAPPRVISSSALNDPLATQAILDSLDGPEIILVPRSAAAKFHQHLTGGEAEGAAALAGGGHTLVSSPAQAEADHRIDNDGENGLVAEASPALQRVVLAVAEAGAVTLGEMASADNEAHLLRQKTTKLPPMPAYAELRPLEARLHECLIESDDVDKLNAILSEVAWSEDAAEEFSLTKAARNGLDINAAHPRHGGSPLHVASQLGRLEAMQRLLDLGVTVDACAGNLSTPLHWAAGAGQEAAVVLLLRNGADPAARTVTWNHSVFGKASGQTSAHWAAESGHTHILHVLHAHSAQALASGDDRSTSPLDLAEKECKFDTTKFLKSALDEDYVAMSVVVSFQARRVLTHWGPNDTPQLPL